MRSRAYPNAPAWAVLPVVLIAFAAAAIAGCGDDDEAAPEARTAAEVNIVKFRYRPPAIRIQAGGMVTWLNSDVAPHTATVEDREGLDTGTLRTAESDAIVFRDPGTYPYICLFHPFMRGTVEVVE
jgi:plastocyanin